jgi:hypothetical protein
MTPLPKSISRKDYRACPGCIKRYVQGMIGLEQFRCVRKQPFIQKARRITREMVESILIVILMISLGFLIWQMI